MTVQQNEFTCSNSLLSRTNASLHRNLPGVTKFTRFHEIYQVSSRWWLAATFSLLSRIHEQGSKTENPGMGHMCMQPAAAVATMPWDCEQASLGKDQATIHKAVIEIRSSDEIWQSIITVTMQVLSNVIHASAENYLSNFLCLDPYRRASFVYFAHIFYDKCT